MPKTPHLMPGPHRVHGPNARPAEEAAPVECPVPVETAIEAEPEQVEQHAPVPAPETDVVHPPKAPIAIPGRGAVVVRRRSER